MCTVPPPSDGGSHGTCKTCNHTTTAATLTATTETMIARTEIMYVIHCPPRKNKLEDEQRKQPQRAPNSRREVQKLLAGTKLLSVPKLLDGGSKFCHHAQMQDMDEYAKERPHSSPRRPSRREEETENHNGFHQSRCQHKS